MTSVLTSSIHAAHSENKAEKSRASEAEGLTGGGLPGEFAALFGLLAELMPRQELATPAAAEGKLSPPLIGLASEILGPSVQLITAATPATSDESLLAFARAQGMDESSLALIFGKPENAGMAPTPLPAAPTPLTAASAPLTAAPTPLPAAPTPLPAALLPVIPAHAALASPGTAHNGTAPAPAPALASTPFMPFGTHGILQAQALGSGRETRSLTASESTAGMPPPTQSGFVELGPDAHISWHLGDSPGATAKALPPVLFGLNGVRAALTQAGADAAAVDAATEPKPAQQSLAASLMLGAAEASQFAARRQQMKQGEQRAERLAGATPAAASGIALASSDIDGDATLELLAIETGITDADLRQLLQSGTQEGRPATQDQRHPVGGGGGTSDGLAGARTDLEERAQHYEQLSQRLGEALGQRLAAQIAKGDWKVEMALRPHDLGRIDIELTMKNGGLEASFSAGQMLTRDLINDGLPRLREVLSQLGMDVASVNVNVRQNSHNGGNPTPGKQSPHGAGIGAARGPGTDTAATEVRSALRVGAADSGLDVLV